MKNIIIKEHGEIVCVTEYMNDIDRELENRHSVHLCWENCLNASAGKCMKIANRIKKPIGKYDFITDGYQIVKENGKIDKFIVTGCKNYVKEKLKKLTLAEKIEIKKKRENLKMTYFGTETIEEAHLLQQDMLNRKILKYARGYVPSKSQLAKMKRK